MTSAAERAMELGGIGPDEVDLFIAHQANSRIIDECGERLGLAPDRVFCNVDRFGNTSAASVAIAVCEAAETGALEPGSTLLISAIGAGFVWGAGVVRWTGAHAEPISFAEGDVLLGVH